MLRKQIFENIYVSKFLFHCYLKTCLKPYFLTMFSLLSKAMRCPAHSHYELCGSACPATCADPNAPSKCRHPCVETCSCNKGYILSGNRCVRANKCGCTHKGRYIPVGQSFWANNSCGRWCRCKGNKQLKCVNKGCRKGQQCKVVKGVRKCHTVSKSTCHARGDPHYMTFDKKKFDFQGTCVYQLAALCAKDTELEPFEVRVQNDHRHNKRVSFTKLVEIKVYSLSIIITTSYRGRILVRKYFCCENCLKLSYFLIKVVISRWITKS